MITIKDFMETVKYRLTEGADYQWVCFGPNAYSLDSWNGDNDTGYSASIIFDTKTQEVYEATTFDYKRNRAYRLLNPEYKQAYLDEAKVRNIDPNVACDDIKYVDLDVDRDFLEKTCAIVAGKDYSTKVTIELELNRDLLFDAAMAAHEMDITLNAFFELALEHAADNYHQSCMNGDGDEKSVEEDNDPAF